MAPFPPGKGSGKGLARGYKGLGVLNHGIVEGQGRLLAASTTPTNGDERAQVLPFLDSIEVKTGRIGRPPKRPAALAGDEGYDRKALRQALRRRGIHAKLNRKGGKPPKGRPIKVTVPRFLVERAWAWLQRRFRRLVVRRERKPLLSAPSFSSPSHGSGHSSSSTQGQALVFWDR